MLILGNDVHVRLYLLGLIYVATLIGSSAGAKYEFDACDMKDNSPGVCRVFHQCQPLVAGIKSGTVSIKDPVHCGYKGQYELICCPMNSETWQSKDGSSLLTGSTLNTTSSTTTTTTTTTTAPTIATTKPSPKINVPRTERPAVEACRIIQADLSPVLTPHILDGTPVNPGDYPHMAAIGYSIGIGNEGGPYEFRCGGTLIHERFILTAAHCVSNPNVNPPAIVRLGMSNFDDPYELPHKVDVPILKVHIHPQHSSLNRTNDIALLEFENPVQKTKYISPTCLYTENADPPPDAVLFVAGWGVINKTSGQKSNALLKTRMNIVPDSSCFESYRKQLVTLQAAHLCAAAPNEIGDACWGDSGGPLLLQVDESTLDFAQVAVISAGYGCANRAIPGLYMRVTSYLDFIESIVWPTN